MTTQRQREPLTGTRLAQKIRWEGGVMAALEYGIQPDDISDPELATLWAELVEAHRCFSPLLEEVSSKLDVAA